MGVIIERTLLLQNSMIRCWYLLSTLFAYFKKLTSTKNLHTLNFVWKMMFVSLEKYIAILELISFFLTLLPESVEESSN